MPHRNRAAALVGVLFAFLLAVSPTAAAASIQTILAPNAIERISNGTTGVGGGTYASVSRDSRYVVFESTAPDLASGQVEDSWDVFLHDRQAHTSKRISTNAQGQPVYNPGVYTAPPAIASTGGQIAFMSSAADLVAGDSNGMPDVFLYDPAQGKSRLVSAARDGGPANGPSFQPVLSADGRFVAFLSYANNLVSGDTNDSLDVFVRDTVSNTTERVSVTSSGEQGYDASDLDSFIFYASIAISDGGRWVAFSYEHLPIDGQPGQIGPRIYLHNRDTHTTRAVATGRFPALSGTGRYLVFVSDEPLATDDRNNSADVYFVDLAASQDVFERISITSQGGEATLQDIYSAPDVTDDGQFVVFASNGGLASSGTAERFHIYLRSRAAGTTSLISRAANGLPANGDSDMPVIAGDGRCVAFSSLASDLVADDTNDRSDVFVFDRTAPTVLARDFVLHFPVISK